MIDEDAPVNNVGSGIGVPGAGVTGPGKPANFGDPIVSRKSAKAWKAANAAQKGIFRRKQPMMEETFAGATVFEVNSKLFHSLTLAKRKGKHWRTYLEEDDCYAEIREWANKNRGPIIVRNAATNEMRYIRYKG
mgnify:CR=1 FL=1